ncbi:MAG: hypothetical protein WC455_11410 [Dehalococcoidia bacterium]|jgi:hypothetical protein
MISRLIMVLALATPALGQDLKVEGFGPAQAAVAEPISISGPDKADAGEVVVFRLVGTPAIDLSQPLVDQLEWLTGEDRMFAYVAMPGHAMTPLDVEGTIVFSPRGATMRPQLTFGVAEPGEYRLLVDWNYGQNQLVEHTVVVEGDSPDPFPDPEPQPGPIPKGTRLALVLAEAQDLTASQAAVIRSLDSYLRTTPSHRYRYLDPDTPTLGDWGAPYKEKVQELGLSLPAILVSVLPDQANQLDAPYFVHAGELPATAAEALTKLKEALQ